MRIVLLLSVLLVLAPNARAEKSERIEAGKVSLHYPDRERPYAIYAPTRWRKRKPVPLVIHVLQENMVPSKQLKDFALPPQADEAAASGFPALHAAVLLEAHNKENAWSTRRVDRDRYVKLLERDAGHVAAVIEDIAAEVPIRRDAIFIRGMSYAGEAALGLATRRPGLFAGAMGYNLECSTIGWLDNDYVLPWAALASDSEKARDLPVFLTHEPSSKRPDTVALLRHKVSRLKALLKGLGFRHVVGVSREGMEGSGQYLTPEGGAWLEEQAAKRAVRTQKTTERDGLLEDGVRHLERRRFVPALRAYRKARALEAEHALDEASAALYAGLESRGRALLAEADALEPPKRMSAYKKIARLFEGTPLGEEVHGLLEAMR